jgi:cephalosporin-C deacetylase-like acetyl esterase
VPEVVGRLAGDGFDVEKVIFQSLPRVYVTANLYVPRGLAGPTGAVLFVCGHAEEAKTYPLYQAVCQRLARNGLVVLAIDPLGQGERKSYLDAEGRELVRWGTVEHSYAGLQCWWLGHSVARYFVHDARRAVDYLLTRSEVDPARIGITGNSGGGTQATWMMLLEPRLAAAAPGTFVTRRREYLWTGQAQDAEQIIPGGTAAGLDHEDYLIAMAPRPVLVLAVDYDFFNVEGTIATVERARRVYRLLGHEDQIGLARARSTHEYHPDLARAATEFFVRHLRGGDPTGPIEVDHAEPRPLPPEDLRCTRSGQVLLDRPDTRRVFDLNLDEHRALPPRPADPTGRAAAARDWLGEAVRRHRRPGELHTRWLPGPTLDGVRAMRGFWWSERDVLGCGVLVRPAEREYSSLLLALLDRGLADLEARREWLLVRAHSGQAVLALDVRGTGALAPHSVNPRTLDEDYGTLFKLECDLLWLDDSLAAGRVFDVLRAVELVRADPEVDLRGRPIHIYGAGLGAFHAYLAAALEPRLQAVELVSPSLDPDEVLATRLYPQGPHWQCLLPGLAARFSLADLRPLFESREVVRGTPPG